jgi:putative salt-induced outer membrane protein YdiY
VTKRSIAAAAALVSVAALVGLPAAAVADTIVFRNGDKITGKIIDMQDGKMRMKSAVAGEIIVDTVDVATFSTDEPIDLQLTEGVTVKQRVEPVGDGRVAIAGEAGQQEVSIGSLKSINPRTGWHGNIRGGVLINRGNTENEDYYAAFDIWMRTQSDRYKFGGEYNLQRSENEEGDKETDEDNWMGYGQFDHFFNEKLYGYARVKVESDKLADLDYRITPSIGLGYQWWEGPESNFFTEGGVAYVYEKYDDDESIPFFDDDDSYVALRLAYHYDRRLNDRLMVFNNVEYLPGLDEFDNFQINADIGVRTDLTKNMFAEAKVEWRHDNIPAEGSEDDDLRYVIAIGWGF